MLFNTYPGIWRRVIKDADKVKTRLKIRINEEEFCLNFDGKRIDNKEYQVVCPRNSARTLILGVLACDSGSAENTISPLQALLQCCPTRGPRAACGPPTDFMRPASAG